MVGYDSMARAFFDLLRTELHLRSMRLQHHVRAILSPSLLLNLYPSQVLCSLPPPLPSLPQALGETSTAISPKALSLLVSHLLYFKFRGSGTAPIVAGLDQDGTPVLCTQGEGREGGREGGEIGEGRRERSRENARS
jgi:hypothetical protein